MIFNFVCYLMSKMALEVIKKAGIFIKRHRLDRYIFFKILTFFIAKLSPSKVLKKRKQQVVLSDPVYSEFLKNCLIMTETSISCWLTLLNTLEQGEETHLKKMEAFADHIVEFFKKLILDLESEHGASFLNTSALIEYKSKPDDTLADNSILRRLLDEKKMASAILDIKSQVEDLWRLLKVPEAFRFHFLKQNSDISLSALDKFNHELNRCQKILENDLDEILNKKRRCLENVWNKCHIGADTRTEFPQFYSNENNTKLLYEFDNEIQKLEVYYNENREIFETLTLYNNLINALLEKELNVDDRTKFKNRGCSLLKFEKLQKQICATEKKLLKLSDWYYKKNGRRFESFSKTIEQHIKMQHNRKEMGKMAGTPIMEPHRALSAKRTQTTSSRIPTKKRKSGVLPKIKLNFTSSVAAGKNEAKAKDSEDEEWIDYSEFQDNCAKNKRSTEYRLD